MGLLSWEPELGWTVGRNLRVEYRWSPVPGDLARLQKDAGELVTLRPEAILARWSARPRPCCNSRRAPFRSSWRKALTQSETAMSRAWRGRVETPPGSFSSNKAWQEIGWSCSKKFAGRNARGGAARAC